MKQHSDVPETSLESVMAASSLIEKMGRERLKPRKDEPSGAGDVLVFDAAVHAVLTVAGSGAVPGAQAGEARIREVVTSAGFSRFRRAAETPLNIVEARP